VSSTPAIIPSDSLPNQPEQNTDGHKYSEKDKCEQQARYHQADREGDNHQPPEQRTGE
jgi:hypothetical protein